MYNQIFNRVVSALVASLKAGEKTVTYGDKTYQRFDSVKLTTVERYFMQGYPRFQLELQDRFEGLKVTVYKRSVGISR